MVEEKEEFNFIEEKKLNKNMINFPDTFQNNFHHQRKEKLPEFTYQDYKFAENLKIKYENHQKLFQFLKKYYDIKLSLSNLGFYINCYSNDEINILSFLIKQGMNKKK